MCLCAYPKLSAKHVDFSLGLLLPESPLYQVLPILPWEGHVSLCHCWVGSTSQHMRLCLIVGVQAAGVQDPQGAIITDLVAIS